MNYVHFCFKFAFAPLREVILSMINGFYLLQENCQRLLSASGQATAKKLAKIFDVSVARFI